MAEFDFGDYRTVMLKEQDIYYINNIDYRYILTLMTLNSNFVYNWTLAGKDIP